MRLSENERTGTGMAEYIEREAAYREICSDETMSGYEKAYCSELIRNIPSADVAPVVHGRWESNSDRPDTLICSVCKCGFDMWKHDPHNFCPNCGAKMDEVNE